MRATGDGSPKKPGRIRHGVDVVLDFIAGCVSPVIGQQKGATTKENIVRLAGDPGATGSLAA